MYLIDIEHVHKNYGALAVLRGISLQVAEGQVYGVLGPHGVGKSTLLHLLLGFLKPSSGKILLLGTRHLEAARQQIGYVPERGSYHARFSPREYLRFLGRFSDLHGPALRRRVDEQLRLVGLSDVADQSIGGFSRSMTQRLGIAQALLTRPALLLLDDPLLSMSPTEQREIADLLASIRDLGTTMLICSNYTHVLTRLCDRIGILAHGYIMDEMAGQQLRVASSSVQIQVDQLTPALRAQLGALSSGVQCSEHMILLRPNSQQLQSRVLRSLMEAGVTILSLEPLEHPLEQFYLQAIQQQTAIHALREELQSTRDRQQPQQQEHSDLIVGDDERIPREDPLLDTLLLRGMQSDEQRRTRDPDER
jgi:ABC-2 type transport system ATP-binding protein